LRKRFGPAGRAIARHQVGLRRWGGLAAVATGVGLMAGGLDPLGFSLIVVGVAVLLVEVDRAGRESPVKKRE
jgi:hypothetical protein